jgi:exodeoxyribonuclease VII large subunit
MQHGCSYVFNYEKARMMPMSNLRRTLYAWRDAEAARRGVEIFRVLQNSALDEIVKTLPQTKDELTAIKGIKEAKWREYGEMLLKMISESSGQPSEIQGFSADILRQPLNANSQGLPERRGGESLGAVSEPEAYSVSTYLDIINNQLSRVNARVRGEVVQLKLQGSAMYAMLKDTEDSSSLALFMWKRDLELSGVELAEGMEVIVEGRSEVYKPSGRFSFRAQTIELVGEGALKKAYDELKKKLDAEGIFAPEKKRTLPDYPVNIGLITSKSGAVIHDFTTNLGKFGFHVYFCDSRVEGAAAVKDILGAIRYFKSKDIDALVLIRGGGGSLELLQTFNNEHVVRAVAEFPRPVVCAIGHDKDVPLVQLAADHAPSTPTACTTLLNSSWIEARHLVARAEHAIAGRYERELWQKKEELSEREQFLRDTYAALAVQFSRATEKFVGVVLALGGMLSASREVLRGLGERVSSGYRERLKEVGGALSEDARLLSFHNPMRQLKLGYSLLSRGGKLVRSMAQLPQGVDFEARLADGSISAKVMKSK